MPKAGCTSGPRSSNRLRAILSIFLAVAPLVCLVAPCFGQAGRAELFGTIQDPSALPISNAKAQAEEQAIPLTTRVKRALEIDEDSPAQEVNVKRARVDDFEREVWVDGRRGRALLGLAIGLGAR